jgi:drug/metabolite transporter (DMT)-like permease
MVKQLEAKKLKAYINLTLAMFISGSAVVVSKLMVTELPTFLATELGILIGLLILIPFTFLILKCEWRYDAKTYLVIFMQAFFGVFLYRIFTFVGLKSTTAVSSGLITSASPVLVLIFAFVLLKDKITFRQTVAVICTVIAILLVNLSSVTSVRGHASIQDHASIGGNLLIMAAVFCEALFSVLSKIKCKPVAPICRTTLIMGAAFLLLLPLSIKDALSYDFSMMSSRSVICVAYYGIFVTFLSYVFWFRGIENVKAGNAAPFTSVVPISSILLSILLLHEKLLLLHMISLVFVIAGIWISCSTGRVRNHWAVKILLKNPKNT